MVPHGLLGSVTKRRARRALLIISPFICTALIFILRQWEQERVRRTEEIFRAIGYDRNTSAKVGPISIDTTLLQPKQGCQFSGSKDLAIILVPSRAENKVNRERIRKTWGKYRTNESMQMFFFLGTPDVANLMDVQTEAEMNGDLIVDDLEDSYYALSFKILRAFKWFVNNCPSAKFLIKVDEDVVVNLPYVAAELRKWPKEYHLGGRIITDNRPHLLYPYSKYFVPQELWSGWSVAPAYLDGPCYVIRGDVVPKILQASYETPTYHFEDIFITGMIANERLKLKQMPFRGNVLIKQDYFFFRYFRSCYFDTCDFTSLHTNQNYVLFMKIFNSCSNFMDPNQLITSNHD